MVEQTPNGKFVLAGNYDAEPSNASTALLRLDPLGAPDPSFGTGGLVLRGKTAPFGDLFEDAAIDAEERTVVVSRAYIGGGNTEVVVTRYLGDRAPVSPGPTRGPGAGTGAPNQAPHAKMKPLPKKLRVGKPKGFFGSASDPDGSGVQKVQIALAKRIKGAQIGGIRDSRPPATARCFALKNAKLRFKRVKAKGGSCPPRRWLTVKGTAKWSLKLKGQLPPGNYAVYARAIDSAGLAEATFSRTLGNRYAFRVVPSR